MFSTSPAEDDRPYFFIIDEINRDNLSKIFGELFMLIESDKRDVELQLLYADDQTMAKLYEKFILGYFQREHPDIKAYSPQIAWQVTDGYRTLLPTMQSDIVVSNKRTRKTLIIDA